jgi:L-rhamnonate dehydratase
MKITEVEAIILRQPALDQAIADGSQDDLVVRVHTDAGIVGVGEVDSAPEVVKAVIEAPASHAIASGLRHVLIGQDPLEVERLWQVMYRAAIYYGRRGVAMHALSGIDIALWDIKGKALGKPVAELIGPAKRNRVRAYASTLMPETEAEASRKVGGLIEQYGFTAVKLGWGPLGRDPVHDVRLARAARRAAGDGVDVLIDAGLGYGADAQTAIRVARELEQLGIFWLEEPFLPDELEAYAELADNVDIRVAAGEEDTTLRGFEELVERGHVDVVQPDVTRCGGITEIVRIAAYASERGKACVPHAWKSGIIKAASLQVNAVLPDAWFQEYCVAETPLNTSLTRQTFPLQDGFVDVPTAPGLGVDLDQAVLERYAVGSRPLRVAG